MKTQLKIKVVGLLALLLTTMLVSQPVYVSAAAPPKQTGQPQTTMVPEQKQEGRNEGENQDIASYIASNPKLSTLSKAIDAAGLTKVLQGKGPYTLFAPSDEAFAQIPAKTLAEMMKPQNKEKLVGVITMHVFDGYVKASTAEKLDGKTITMLNREPVKVTVKDGSLYLNNAKVITKDIQTANGVIHIIDAVIMPEK